MDGGAKYDSEKPKMEYLSAYWIEGVSRVLGFGAKKYEGHNWRKGIAQSRLLGAALRHIFAYLRGEDLDPETGLSHLFHASCCLMFASELKETHPELDDRYKVINSDKEIIKEDLEETRKIVDGLRPRGNIRRGERVLVNQGEYSAIYVVEDIVKREVHND